jgi:hypothetical protein
MEWVDSLHKHPKLGDAVDPAAGGGDANWIRQFDQSS